MGRPQNPMKAPVQEVMKEPSEPHEYEIDDAVKTMQKAEEIKANKKLMPHVHRAIGKKIKSLKSLKSLAGKKAIEEMKK